MTFVAKTQKLEQLAKIYPHRISELENIFLEKTNVYIDWANVIGWQEKLNWHVDVKRLYQFLRSFSNIDKIRWYFGTLVGDIDSEKNIAKVKSYGYEVTTKPVKIMHHSIDISSLKNIDSPDILKSFLTKGLLNHIDSATIRIFNQELQKLNKKGILTIEEKKCNFDVEIGVDMLLDYERSVSKDFYKAYALWSGDSDFTDIVQKIISQGKKVFIFATSKKISRELAESGAIIVDIKKFRDFICRSREIQAKIQETLFK